MMPIVPHNWLPGIIMPHFKLDRKPEDATSKDLVEVPFPGTIADVCLI
jgi:hypothetical protein